MDTPTKQPFVSYTDMKIDKRNQPYSLCCALQGLSAAQKTDISDMGFKSLTSFNIDSIPAGLGYWLLVHYDHKRNELNVGNRKIRVTPSKVHDVLGVPMGKIAVSEKKKVTRRDAFRDEWRSQFSYAGISVKQVVEKLKSHKEGGMLFKLNFLVVFNSIMGETTKSATVNHKFLTAINNEGDIPNMDWCSYIITCLKRTKKGWNGIEPYNGPLTVLAVLYSHEQQLKRSPANSITPALQYVTTDFLVDLESSMYYNGSSMNNDVEEVKKSTQKVEDTVQSLGIKARAQLETLFEPAEVQTDEVQAQTNEGQTAVDQNVSVCDVTSVKTGSVLNLKLPVGPPGAQSLSGLSANLGHCNKHVPPKDEKLLEDDDDDDVVILDTKQEQRELVQNVSRMLDYSLDDDVIILDPKQEQCELVGKFSSYQSGMVCVQGYTVKWSLAKILEAIFKKHGDIAAECLFKTASMRSTILGVICEVAKQIQANDFIEKLEEIESRLSDAKAVNIDVSWLQSHLEAIRERKEAREEYSLLMQMKANTLLAKKATQISLRKRRAELAVAQEQSKKAKRCVELVHLVGQNLIDSFLKSKAKADSWVKNAVV